MHVYVHTSYVFIHLYTYVQVQDFLKPLNHCQEMADYLVDCGNGALSPCSRTRKCFAGTVVAQKTTGYTPYPYSHSPGICPKTANILIRSAPRTEHASCLWWSSAREGRSVTGQDYGKFTNRFPRAPTSGPVRCRGCT